MENKASSSTSDASKEKKRKAGDVQSTKISLKVDGVELTVDRQSGAVNESASKRKKAKPKERARATPKPAPKLKAAKTTPLTTSSSPSRAPPSMGSNDQPSKGSQAEPTLPLSEHELSACPSSPIFLRPYPLYLFRTSRTMTAMPLPCMTLSISARTTSPLLLSKSLAPIVSKRIRPRAT